MYKRIQMNIESLRGNCQDPVHCVGLRILSPNRASGITTLGPFRPKFSPPTKLWGPGRTAIPPASDHTTLALPLRLNFQLHRAVLHRGLRIWRNKPQPVAPFYDGYVCVWFYPVLRTVTRCPDGPLVAPSILLFPLAKLYAAQWNITSRFISFEPDGSVCSTSNSRT